jgi:putative FmdB family regulatory protein
MPLYEYECGKCGRRFEALVSVQKANAQRCEVCGARCRRLLSPPAIIFKGSGFYTTDYARANDRRPSGDPEGHLQDGPRGRDGDGDPSTGSGSPHDAREGLYPPKAGKSRTGSRGDGDKKQDSKPEKKAESKA